jgi:transcriptional regulator with XRE-family HTH domain
MPLVASLTFADLLTETLRDQGLSQREFGRQLAVRQQTVSKWVRGSAVPRVLMLGRIAEVLGLDARELGMAIIGAPAPLGALDRILERLDRFAPDQLAEVERFVAELETRGSKDGGRAGAGRR